jgi:hypothetical protein
MRAGIAINYRRAGSPDVHGNAKMVSNVFLRRKR